MYIYIPREIVSSVITFWLNVVIVKLQHQFEKIVMHTCACMHPHIHVHACTHADIHRHTHMCTHTNTHTHTHRSHNNYRNVIL